MLAVLQELVPLDRDLHVLPVHKPVAETTVFLRTLRPRSVREGRAELVRKGLETKGQGSHSERI